MVMIKNSIAQRFSTAAPAYDRYAVLQKMSARETAREIAALGGSLPPGPVVEVGCGTGSLTGEIVSAMPEKDVVAVDIAVGMIQACRKKLERSGVGANRLFFMVADGEALPMQGGLAAIITGLTLQWFDNIRASAAAMLGLLAPQGVLLCSWVGSGSFPEWRNACDKARVPYTANSFPPCDFHTALELPFGVDFRCWKKEFTVSFASSLDFFKSLQQTGSATSREKKGLTAGELKKVVRVWDSAGGRVSVTYEVCYLLARKKGAQT